MPRLLIPLIFFSSFLSLVGLNIISVFAPTHWHLARCAVYMLMSQRSETLKLLLIHRFLFYHIIIITTMKKIIVLFGFTYCHAGATLGEVDHRGIELVFEEVSMSHHSPSQSQTGGSHQNCSHHLGSRCRFWEGNTWQRIIQKKCGEKLIFEALKKKVLKHAGEDTSARCMREEKVPAISIYTSSI